MTSATSFPVRWPSSTFGPGLHNLEIHAEQSSCGRGWSAARAALHLQTLYGCLSWDNTDCFIHLDGSVYRLGRGLPLPFFLDELEAKHENISVLMATLNRANGVDVAVLAGECAEELVPGCQNRGSASQFSWAFRWMLVKSRPCKIRREYDSLRWGEVDG
jgi:hypothetical protein